MSSTPAFRVWLGWRTDALRKPGGRDQFLGHLRSIFIPATWQVMPAFGLRAYLPSVFAPDHGDDWPDETALLVYADTHSYDQRTKSVAGRAYGLLHRAVFEFAAPGGAPGGAPGSRSDWAVAWPTPASKAVAAWWWPAAAEGPVLAGADANAVFVAFGHADAAATTADDVRSALGSRVKGEMVVCHEKTMTFVWLATCGKQRAADAASALQTAWPAWTLRAAHDAVRAPQPIDEVHGVALADQQTLHFMAPAPAEAAPAV